MIFLTGGAGKAEGARDNNDGEEGGKESEMAAEARVTHEENEKEKEEEAKQARLCERNKLNYDNLVILLPSTPHSYEFSQRVPPKIGIQRQVFLK